MNYYSEEQVTDLLIKINDDLNRRMDTLGFDDYQQDQIRDSFDSTREQQKPKPSLTLPAPGEPWTPESVFLIDRAKGWDGIFQGKNGRWRKYMGQAPILNEGLRGGWECLRCECVEEIKVPIAYSGRWQDSLRGPVA